MRQEGQGPNLLADVGKFIDEDIDFNEDLWALGDVPFYDSPLDQEDPVLFFRDTVNELETSNPEVYEMIVSNLDADKVETMKRCFEQAEV